MAKRKDIPAWMTGLLARLLAGYLRFCVLTIRWQGEGRDALAAALAEGPVILVIWHSRLFLAPAHWPFAAGPIATLRDPSPAGNLSAAFQSRFGVEPISMSPRQSDRSSIRIVRQAMNEGRSLGLTADGPTGPAFVAKAAPIDWARIAGRPVWLYAFSVQRGLRLKTWDRMLLPLPFTRGAFLFRAWDVTIDRHADAETLERARESLTVALNALMAEADARAAS